MWLLLGEAGRKKYQSNLQQGGRQGCTCAVLLLLLGLPHHNIDGLRPHLHVTARPSLLDRHSGFLIKMTKKEYIFHFEVVIVVKPSAALAQLAKFVLAVLLGCLILILSLCIKPTYIPLEKE